MTIFGWLAFAVINMLIMMLLDYNPDKDNIIQGSILGITGALSASILIYFFTRGMNQEFILTFSLVILIESFFLMTLFFTKSFSQSLHR